MFHGPRQVSAKKRHGSPISHDNLMAIAVAWLSVLIVRDSMIVVPRTVMNVSSNDDFGAVVDGKYEGSVHTISNNDQFVDPAIHKVPINAPVNLCNLFKCFHFRISLFNIKPQHYS